MWIAIGSVAGFIFIWYVWRYFSVERGNSQRFKRQLVMVDSVLVKLRAKETVSLEEIMELSQRPELREFLYALWYEADYADFIPTDFDSSILQGESALAQWLMHPNEFQDPPETIEYLKTIQPLVNGEEFTFHVFRFRMHDKHWSADHGWMLGLAGPMRDKEEPYTYRPSAFAREENYEGSISPEALVEQHIDLMRKMGMVT